MSAESLKMSCTIGSVETPFEHGRIFVKTGSPAFSAAESCVVTIGAFDGVHLGHRSLVESALFDARERGTRCIAVMFDPDPADVVGPKGCGERLMRIEDRRDTMLRLGVDAVAVLTFTASMASLGPRPFIEHVLLEMAPVVSVHVGSNFRFGCRGAGDTDTLHDLGGRYGFDVVVHELLDMGAGHVSSSRIRELLRTANLDGANALLGRSHFVRGRVLHGRGEGTSFGFPTANVQCEAADCLPCEGVYACYVVSGHTAWPAAANVGAPPTFSSSQPAFLEANLIGFAGDLYGAEVTVFFEKWLRASRVFDSLDELENVVLENISWVRHNLGDRALEVRP